MQRPRSCGCIVEQSPHRSPALVLRPAVAWMSAGKPGGMSTNQISLRSSQASCRSATAISAPTDKPSGRARPGVSCHSTRTIDMTCTHGAGRDKPLCSSLTSGAAYGRQPQHQAPNAGAIINVCNRARHSGALSWPTPAPKMNRSGGFYPTPPLPDSMGGGGWAMNFFHVRPAASILPLSGRPNVLRSAH